MTENYSAHSTTGGDRGDNVRRDASEVTLDAPSGWGDQPTRGIFWPSQAIAVGPGWFSDFHHHYATQVCISFGAPLRVRMYASGPYTEQRSLIVGPHVPHELETTGIPCFVLWSESRALADLARHLRITSGSELPALPEDLLSVLRPLLLPSGEQALDEQAGRALLSRVLTTLVGPSWDEGPDDPRIAKALSLVTPQFLVEQSQPIKHLAICVHLSPGRFRHLFRTEMGISVQSYLRWRRLYTALRTTVYGASLTEAAHAAGFADSAHLTRVFRATFGLPPSRIFKNSHAVQFILGAES